MAVTHKITDCQTPLIGRPVSRGITQRVKKAGMDAIASVASVMISVVP